MRVCVKVALDNVLNENNSGTRDVARKLLASFFKKYNSVGKFIYRVNVSSRPKYEINGIGV